MSRYLLPRLQAMAPYVPGEQPQGKKLTKLNTNELPYPPSPRMMAAVQAESSKLNLYNDPESALILGPLARFFGVSKKNVFVGNGSDEILAFIFYGMCPNGAAFADLTYGFYPVYAELYGLETTVVPLRENFALCPEEYYGIGRTIFIANPNAPTGLALTPAEIEDIVKANPDNLVVVDEAYVDFGAESVQPLCRQYDNLLVVGTFSKSRAMAGARLGYAVGCDALIEDLNRLKFSFNPYNVNRMTQAAGAAALDDEAYLAHCRERVCTTRARATAELEKLGFACTDSRANFLFASHPAFGGEQLLHALRERDILVRWFNKPRIRGWLRITVGTDEEMDKLLAALDEIIRGKQ